MQRFAGLPLSVEFVSRQLKAAFFGAVLRLPHFFVFGGKHHARMPE